MDLFYYDMKVRTDNYMGCGDEEALLTLLVDLSIM